MGWRWSAGDYTTSYRSSKATSVCSVGSALCFQGSPPHPLASSCFPQALLGPLILQLTSASSGVMSGVGP